jgi:DNA adenine methylase
LRKRILAIASVKDRIRFIEGDGLQVMRENVAQTDAVFFLDPPYTAAGKKAGTRLYKYNELDHEELFSLTATVSGDFLMTYDNAPGVVEMTRRHGLDTEAIPMKNTHHAEMMELLVGRNLNWVRPSARQPELQRLLF